MSSTNKMELAKEISGRDSLNCYDVQSAVDNFCISGCRRLRELAREYCLRTQSRSAYYYRSNAYFFNKGFRQFCGRWYREQVKKLSK